MTDLNIYCDEVIRPNSNEVILLGALFIKEIDLIKAVNYLENKRCLNTSNHKWSYTYDTCPNNKSCKKALHDKNNTKIHFSEIDRHRERKIISQKWLTSLKVILKENIKFSILAIDLNKLDCEHFGRNKTDLNIYNRFFRTLLKGGVRYLYSKEKVKIKTIYHDEGSQNKHRYFPELNMKKLELETFNDINIENKKIVFLNDDHRIYLENNEMESVRHSQFIQLIDIILGSFSQLRFNLSIKEDKKEVAEVMRDVFESIFDRKWEYSHSISFFPKYSLDELAKMNQYSLNDFNEKKIEDKIDIALKHPDNFYNKNELAMPKYVKNQNKLTAWA